MSDNLDLGPEAAAAHTLGLLRGLDWRGSFLSDQPLVPGFFLSLDPEGSTRVAGESRSGMLLDASFTVEQPGRWMTLHLTLGGVDLRNRSVLGFLLKGRATEPMTLQACLRSGKAGGDFTDTPFRKPLVLLDRILTHLDLLQLSSEGAPPLAPWRELVIFLRPESCRLVLDDLRLFIV